LLWTVPLKSISIRNLHTVRSCNISAVHKTLKHNKYSTLFFNYKHFVHAL
jgi:hypothetical protein